MALFTLGVCLSVCVLSHEIDVIGCIFNSLYKKREREWIQY